MKYSETMLKLNLLLVATLSIFSSLLANPIIVHSENFDDCNNISWINIAATADNDSADEWTCDGTNGLMSVTGFSGGVDEDWLVSPAIDLDAQIDEYLIFDYKNVFDGPDIKLFYSLDFSGTYSTANLESANWTEIPTDLYDIYSDNKIFNPLPQTIDIKNISGTAVYFAFRYTADGNAGGSETWELDNIRILADYYNTLNNSFSCEALKSNLHDIIKGHTVISYTGSDFDVWDSQYATDSRLSDDGTKILVRDRYSENPNGPDPYEYMHGVRRDQGIPVTAENNYYNREHLFPVSWWGGSNGETQYTDIHAIIPSDKYVNSMRFNYPMGEVANATWTSMNGSKLGDSGSPGYTEIVFEPIDEYKGDIARSFLYMAVRYEDVIGGWETESLTGSYALDGDGFSVYEDWYRNQMLAWHAADPVSQIEIDRNNAIYAIQGNRNPFIDQATLALEIWGPVCFGILPVEIKTFTANEKGKGVQLNWETASEINNDYYDLEHSVDGIQFNTIHRVKGFSNSTENKSYSFFHDHPVNGNNYYRLQQVDLDGQTNSLSTQVVSFQADEHIRFFPNPFRDQLKISLVHSKTTQVLVKNMLGNKVKQFEIDHQNNVLDLSEFSSGTYFFEIWQEGQFLKVEKLVKF